MKARKVIARSLEILSLAIAIIPIIIWIRNPEMTEMQIFLSYWWIYLICLGVFGVSIIVRKRL